MLINYINKLYLHIYLYRQKEVLRFTVMSCSRESRRSAARRMRSSSRRTSWAVRFRVSRSASSWSKLSSAGISRVRLSTCTRSYEIQLLFKYCAMLYAVYRLLQNNKHSARTKLAEAHERCAPVEVFATRAEQSHDCGERADGALGAREQVAFTHSAVRRRRGARARSRRCGLDEQLGWWWPASSGPRRSGAEGRVLWREREQTLERSVGNGGHAADAATSCVALRRRHSAHLLSIGQTVLDLHVRTLIANCTLDTVAALPSNSGAKRESRQPVCCVQRVSSRRRRPRPMN